SDDFEKLWRKRQRTSSDEYATLQALSSTLVSLEDFITDLVIELGGGNLLTSSLDPTAQMLLQVRVSKKKLYESKLGKVESRKKWDKPGIVEGCLQILLSDLFLWQTLMQVELYEFCFSEGPTEQAMYKSVMDKRNKALLQRYNSYKASVETYHQSYPDSPPLQLPTIEEVKSLDITDVF
ncbi:hypothetical protein DFH28DRAFT_891461, partial [Melampsora americana]